MSCTKIKNKMWCLDFDKQLQFMGWFFNVDDETETNAKIQFHSRRCSFIIIIISFITAYPKINELCTNYYRKNRGKITFNRLSRIIIT